MRKKKKRQVGIFTKLVISYVIFALSLLVIIIGFAVITFFLIGNQNLFYLYPYSIIDENDDVSEESLNAILEYGGRVEVLDKELNVLEVYGHNEKATKKYSQDEIFALTSTSVALEEDVDYLGFLSKSNEKDLYYLVLYDRSEVKHTLNFNITDVNGVAGLILPLTFLLAFIILCVLLGLYLSRGIKRPLKAMTNGMLRIKAKEKGVRLDFKANAEFALLRDSFNMMISSLEKEQEINIEYEEKKNKMLLELSHDIRTPISTINSCALALEEGLVNEDKRKEYYKIIRQKAIRVSDLSDDMFTLLQMGSESYIIEKTPKNICEFMRQLCAGYYDEAQNNGLEISVDIPEEHIMVLADYNLLSRAFGNLIENAIKYNKTGKNVFVSINKTTEDARIDNIIIEIADDGSPIDPEIRNTLFEAFSRADSARKTDGGSGLGLSIAKTIFDKHNWEIVYNYNHYSSSNQNSLKCNSFTIVTDKKGRIGRYL